MNWMRERSVWLRLSRGFYIGLMNSWARKKALPKERPLLQRLVFDPHLGFDRKPRPKQVIGVLFGIAKIDAHRNPLHDLDVISGRVFRWKQAENGSGSTANLGYLPVELAASVGIDRNDDRLVLVHLFKLGLLEICRNPDVIERDEGHHVLADADILAKLDAFAGDDAGLRGDDPGIAEIQPGLIQLGLRLRHHGGGLIGPGLLDGNLLRSSLRVL